MKKAIVGAIVGGIIIFLCQFLSWGALNFHEAQQQYTPKQDSIIAFLSTQFSQDGGYFVPTYPPGQSSEEMEKQMKSSEGKPWAVIQYHKSMAPMNKMYTNMAQALVVDIIAVWLLCWLLIKIPTPGFGTIFLGTLGTGFIVFLNAPYTLHIWYETFDVMAHLADAFLQWGLTGLWLGWWLRRKTR